jgi:hypothetical protein
MLLYVRNDIRVEWLYLVSRFRDEETQVGVDGSKCRVKRIAAVVAAAIVQEEVTFPA